MKRKNLLLLCVIALVAICLASCGLVENLPGSDKLPGCIELYGSHSVKHVDAKDATCTEAGNIEYWYCESCGTVWSDSANTQQITAEDTVVAKINHEYTYACDAICAACGELTNESATHTIAHVEAKAPTCGSEGNIEYWYCTDCGYAWADEKLTKVTNLKSVIIPELECNTVHFEAIAPACHYNGQIEHWVCYDCKRVWQDEALTQLTNIKNVVLPATGNGLLVYMEATEAGCHSNGCIEHWICYTCEQVWQDEALTQLTNIKNVTIPAKGSNLLVHMDAVAPGCHYTGNVEHWICYECNGVWTDEALTQVSNVKNVVIPELGGDVVHVDAKAPTCTELGNIEYWYCEACKQVWQNEARTQLTNFQNVKLGAEHTLLVHVDAVEPGCHFLGNVEYWICYACESVWTDEALTQVSNVKNVIIPELGGDVIHVEAVEAVDCQTMGNIEYWYCEACMQVWQDEARTQLTNMMNVKTGYGEHKYFAACDPVCMVCYELTNPEATHTIVHVEAVEATCQAMGNVEYWTCSDCGGCWDNAEANGWDIRRMIYTFAECTPAYACEKVCQWCYEVVNADATHTLTHVEAVESACNFNGNVEYWTCSDCGGYWLDEALTKSTTATAVKLPYGEHEYYYACDAWCMVCYEPTKEEEHKISKVDAKAPTCITLGNIEYYTCEYCGGCWDNENATGMPLNQMMVKIGYVECETATVCDTTCKWCFNKVADSEGHNIVFVPAAPVTCLEAGCTTDHWYCTNCHSAWLDEELTLYVSKGSLMIPTKGVHTYTYECDKVCNVCLEVTAPEADHTIVHVEAWEGTCVTYGNVEYWYCSDCGSAWLDDEFTLVTNKMSVYTTLGDHGYYYACDPVCMYCYEITNPEAAHDLTHVEGVAPTCTEVGNVEYWTCSICGGAWTDETATGIALPKGREILGATGHAYTFECDAHCNQCGELTNPEAAHELTHVKAVAPTCTENGNIEYWTCSICGGAWTNETATGIALTKGREVLGATGHAYTYECDAHCNKCGELTNPEAAHTLEHVEGVAPTCTEVGNIEYWTCSICGGAWDNETATGIALTKGREILGATGHDYEGVVTAPTCTEAGYTTYTCADCGDEYVDTEVDALGHDYDAAVTAPTCTKAGYTTYTCSECGDNYIDDEVVATGHTYVDGFCSACGKQISIAEALEVAVGTKVVLTGKVTGFYEVWSSYNNCSPYITDEEGNTILIFRTTVKVGIGDVVTVTGVIGVYSNVNQVAKENQSLTIDIAHVCSEWKDATCKAPKTCTVCGATEGDVTDHNYVNGECTMCGEAQGVSYTTISTTIDEYGNANGWVLSEGSTSGGQWLTMTLGDVTITIDATDSNSGKWYSGQWRIYQTGSPKITFTAADGKTIKSVKISYTVTNTGVLTQDGNNITSGTTVEVNADTITFGVGNTGTSTKGQVRITAIEVVYG